MNAKRKRTAPVLDGGVEAAVAAGKEVLEAVVEAGKDMADKTHRTAVDLTRDRLDDAMDRGLQGVKGYEDMVGLGRSNMEAVMKTGTVFARGAQEINSMLLCMMRNGLADNVAATKAMLGCRDVKDLMAVQQAVTKINAEKMIKDGRRLADASLRVVAEILEPLVAQMRLAPVRVSNPFLA